MSEEGTKGSSGDAPGPTLDSLAPPPAQQEQLSIPVESLAPPPDPSSCGPEPALDIPVDALSPPSQPESPGLPPTAPPVEALDSGASPPKAADK